ncbi:MAG: autotransporter domain-containing protein [Chlamydiia bacterium]|nr:autotransporter domain-containing protein [Chlamydiia bacterium]
MMNIAIYGLLVLAFIVPVFPADGVGYDHNYVALDMGYRYDRVDEKQSVIYPQIGKGTFIEQLKNGATFTLGASGAWSMPCNRFLVKGEGHYGWLDADVSQFGLAKASGRGNTVDYSVAVGYSFDHFCALEIIPFIGYGYDRIKCKTSNFTAPDAVDVDFVPEEKRYTFYAPWVGLDLVPRIDCLPFDLSMGYEFHYGRSKVSTKTDPAFILFGQWTYEAKFKHTQGHVFRLEGSKTFCESWLANLALKYTYWRNNADTFDVNGFIEESVDLPGTIQYGEVLQWRSFSLTFSLGKTF